MQMYEFAVYDTQNADHIRGFVRADSPLSAIGQAKFERIGGPAPIVQHASFKNQIWHMHNQERLAQMK